MFTHFSSPFLNWIQQHLSIKIITIFYKQSIQHNLSTHDIELYSLETRLFKDSVDYGTDFGENQTQLMNKAIYYLEQFRYTSQSQKSYGLSATR